MPEPVSGRRLVAAWLLTAAAGGMDALAFLRLGHVFASVQTGNLVLVGVSVANRNASLITHVAVSVGGFIIGGLLAARAWRATTSATSTPRRGAVAAVLGVGALLLLALTLCWQLQAPPHGALVWVDLALGSGAMGAQSVACRAVALPVPSTTYLTGTLTTVLAASGPVRLDWRRATSLVALVAGAAGCGLLVLYQPRYAPVLLLVLAAAGVTLLVSDPEERVASSSTG